jgi:hypothetical protein
MKRILFLMLSMMMFTYYLCASSWIEMIFNAVETNPTQRYNNGDIYKGLLDGNNRRHGWGAYIWDTSNDFYIGEWRDGQRNGFGIFMTGSPDRHISNCPDARVYIGNFANNQKSQQGRIYDNFGDLIFSGNFQNDRPGVANPNARRTVFQILDYPFDGSYYIGETFNDLRDGIGVYVWREGSLFIGNWIEHNRRGQGAEIVNNGTVNFGNWDNNTVSNRSGTTVSPRVIQLPPVIATATNQQRNVSGNTGNTRQGNTELQRAIHTVTNVIMRNMDKNMSYAITNVASTNEHYAEYVFGVLESVLVRNNYNLKNRHQIDEVLKEQGRQMSDDFDQNTAVRIGRFAGAQMIITGNITVSGGFRTVRFRVIDVESNRVIASDQQEF